MGSSSTSLMHPTSRVTSQHPPLSPGGVGAQHPPASWWRWEHSPLSPGGGGSGVAGFGITRRLAGPDGDAVSGHVGVALGWGQEGWTGHGPLPRTLQGRLRDPDGVGPGGGAPCVRRLRQGPGLGPRGGGAAAPESPVLLYLTGGGMAGLRDPRAWAGSGTRRALSSVGGAALAGRAGPHGPCLPIP